MRGRYSDEKETISYVTHGQCNARPTVTFPAAGHHRPLAGTKLYCLLTEAHVCEQLAQGCYLKREAGSRTRDRPSRRRKSNALTIAPPGAVVVHFTEHRVLPASELRDEAVRHTPTLNAIVGRSGRLSSHRHARHDKTVLSVVSDVPI